MNKIYPRPGGQTQFFSNWVSRYVFLEGGWAGGKTFSGAHKLLALHLHNSAGINGKPTGVWSAIVAPTYANAKDFCIPEFLSACEKANLPVVWRGGDKEFVFPDHPVGRVMVRTADKPSLITGWQVGAFWGDEVARWKEDEHNPKNDPLTQILGRLRSPLARFRQGVFTYTNEGEGTAAYKMAHSGRADVALYRAATKDNNFVSEFYDSMLETLTPELQKQYLDGGAINLRGKAVYPYFDDESIDPGITLDRNLPLDLAIDFNINPGMHAEIGQHWEDRDVFTVRHELHAPGMSVRGLVDALGRWVNKETDGKGFRWPMLRIFGDASGNARWAGSGESNYDVLEQGLDSLDIPYEFRVPRSNPFVEDRVQAFNVALCDLQNKRSWFVHPDCTRLIEDLRSMKRDAKGVIDKDDQALSHASDAEGYRIYKMRPILRPTRSAGGIAIG